MLTIGVIFLIIGVGLLILIEQGVFSSSVNDTIIIIGWVITILSVIVIICIGLIMLINIGYKVPKLIIEYDQDKAVIESYYDKEVISPEEKAYILSVIVNDNSIINEFRKFQNNFFIGFMYSEEIASLELFDIERIPSTKLIIQEE